MHFHSVLLHISGSSTIHLTGCMFFNKFTTIAFFPLWFTCCNFSLTANLSATLLPKKCLLLQLSSFAFLPLLILPTVKHITESQTGARSQFDPARTERRPSFDRRGPRAPRWNVLAAVSLPTLPKVWAAEELFSKWYTLETNCGRTPHWNYSYQVKKC